MKIDRQLPKASLKKQWFPAGLAWLILAASAVACNGQTDPTVTQIGIDTNLAVRTADVRWFGINSTVYCPDWNLKDGVPEISKAGWRTFRFPGGSISDNYHWATHNSVSSENVYTNFATVATNMGATVIITANYGSGTPAEAAGWVANANNTNHYGFKYWEIGNEEYGTYETDNHSLPHCPYQYATNFATFMQQMKAFDPTIKVGAIVTSPLDPTQESNGYTNAPATNLVTGQVYYGWTPVVLSTLRQLGVKPDFIIEHYYPEDYPGVPDNDQTLLAGTGNWAGDASGLRGQITDFYGPGGTNIELIVTENNSEAGTAGKQSVSLVNAIYYADSLGQLMQTEFNSLVWWDYTDAGPGTSGDTNSSLYGWREYGDLGVMMPGTAEPLTNRYPQYFAAEIISRFIGPGDTVLNVSTVNPLATSYAALRTNGNLTLMTIDKSANISYPLNIVLTNFVPAGTATVYSYGKTNDNMAKVANNNCDITTNVISGVGTNFNYTNVPYSIVVFSFTPAPTPIFSGLGDYTISYGTAGVVLAGTVSANGTNLPNGTAVNVTINGNAQDTTISDSFGDFNINYNTTGLPASATPYVITYSSAVAVGFNAATDSSTTLTVNQLPVVLTGTEAYNGAATASASILSVSNLVGSDNVILSGSVGLGSGNVGAEPIVSFAGLTLGGTAATNYTLTGASGTVTITGSGVILGGISVSPDGTQFIFNYPTVSGQTYQLEYSTNLSSGMWLPMGGPVLGTGDPVSVTNSISSSMQMFFILSITD